MSSECEYQRDLSFENEEGRTCNSNDEFLTCDPCAHAEEDFMACVEMVERSSQGYDWVKWRWG